MHWWQLIGIIKPQRVVLQMIAVKFYQLHDGLAE
jgi:hypothetical protein